MASLTATDTFVGDSIQRHMNCNWGEMHPEDCKENDQAVDRGYRVMSKFIHAATDTTIWIITEADRSSTTLLLPEEY